MITSSERTWLAGHLQKELKSVNAITLQALAEQLYKRLFPEALKAKRGEMRALRAELEILCKELEYAVGTTLVNGTLTLGVYKCMKEPAPTER